MLARTDIAGIAGADLAWVQMPDGVGQALNTMGTHKDVYEYYIDHDYINVMGMQIIAGRNFDPVATLIR